MVHVFAVREQRFAPQSCAQRERRVAYLHDPVTQRQTLVSVSVTLAREQRTACEVRREWRCEW